MNKRSFMKDNSMPKLVDHDVYRQELLTRAFSVFAETGYGSLSMKDLASELDISPGLLYRYFSGKEEMFLMMVRQFIQVLLGELAAEVTTESTLERKLEAIFSHLGRREGEYQHLFLALNDFIRLIGLGEFQNAPGMSDRIRGYVALLQSTLALTSEQTLILLTYLQGVLLSGVFLPSRTPLREHQRILLQLLQASAAAPEKESKTC